jgi:hypothetical protein
VERDAAPVPTIGRRQRSDPMRGAAPLAYRVHWFVTANAFSDLGAASQPAVFAAWSFNSRHNMVALARNSSMVSGLEAISFHSTMTSFASAWVAVVFTSPACFSRSFTFAVRDN